MYIIRKYTDSDRKKLLNLYQQAAKDIGGIARTVNEINNEYIAAIIKNAAKNGIHLVVNHPTDTSKIIGEIHCYKLEPSVFSHVLSDLTMVIAKDFQGKGVGKLVLKSLLTAIETDRNDILRVELIARESNKKAIQLYEKLGFKIEGKLAHRIDVRDGTFEADIPMAWMNKNYQQI